MSHAFMQIADFLKQSFSYQIYAGKQVVVEIMIADHFKQSSFGK